MQFETENQRLFPIQLRKKTFEISRFESENVVIKSSGTRHPLEFKRVVNC